MTTNAQGEKRHTKTPIIHKMKITLLPAKNGSQYGTVATAPAARTASGTPILPDTPFSNQYSSTILGGRGHCGLFITIDPKFSYLLA